MADRPGPSSSKRPFSPSAAKQPAPKRPRVLPPPSWDILAMWPKGRVDANSGVSPAEHCDAGQEFTDPALLVKGALICRP
jgi:hypothetical protein